MCLNIEYITLINENISNLLAIELKITVSF